MGYRDSPAQVGGRGAVRVSRNGVAAAAPRPQREEQAAVAGREGAASMSGEGSSASTAAGDSLSTSARVLLMAVRVYQTFFSAVMPSACKFYPTCSHYAAEAIQLHGARRGARLALRRIGRCHPFTRGGVDLVPDPEVESPVEHAAEPLVEQLSAAQASPAHDSPHHDLTTANGAAIETQSHVCENSHLHPAPRVSQEVHS